tara:strand:- start:2560 stop:3006 length:447 start_codon:yes stop_codon:yes gene_type:complete
MGQRISIQYSIDVEELPGEVSRILQGALSDLKDAQSASLKKVSSDTIMSLDTIEELDQVRQQLARVDHALSDVNNLVTSFLNYKTTSGEEKEEAPGAPTGMPPGMPSGMPGVMPNMEGLPSDLEGLQQRIEEFKKHMAVEDGSDEVSD